MLFTMAGFPVARSSDQVVAPWRGGGRVVMEVSCQKRSRVHGQAMGNPQEGQGGGILSASATGETGTETPLFWCPVPKTMCPLVGS